MSCDQFENPDAAAVSVAADQRPQRPEVRRLVAAPGHADRLLARPAGPPEQHARPGVHLVQRPLHGAPVQQPVPPRGLSARPPVGEPDVVGQVPALAVVGLDPLDTERQQPLGLRAPPLLGAPRREVDGRARCPSTSARRTARRRRRARTSTARSSAPARRASGRLLVRRVLAVARLEVHPRRDPHDGPHAVRAQPRHVPRRVRELVRVELPRVVLRRPGRVEHDRVERQVVLAEPGDSPPRRRAGAGRRRGSSRTRSPTPAARPGTRSAAGTRAGERTASGA